MSIPPLRRTPISRNHDVCCAKPFIIKLIDFLLLKKSIFNHIYNHICIPKIHLAIIKIICIDLQFSTEKINKNKSILALHILELWIFQVKFSNADLALKLSVFTNIFILFALTASCSTINSGTFAFPRKCSETEILYFSRLISKIFNILSYIVSLQVLGELRKKIIVALIILRVLLD